MVAPRSTSRTLPTFCQEPADEARVTVIAEAAQELVQRGDEWLNVLGLSEKEPKKHTLINLYNQHLDWPD